MRKSPTYVLLLSLITTCAGPVACGKGPDAPAPADLSARLEQDTGVPWAVHIDASKRAVRFLAPRDPVAVTEASPELAARGFFERYRASLYGGDAADELRLMAKNEATPDEEDGAYVRFEHYLKGTDITVFDVNSTARFTKGGALMWLQSGFRADLATVPRAAAVSSAQAAEVANGKFDELCGMVVHRNEAAPRYSLGVSLAEGSPRLVWRVQILRETDRCSTATVTIDATTGAFVALRNEAQNVWDDNPGVRFTALGEAGNIRRIDVTPIPFTPAHAMVTESYPKVSTSIWGGGAAPITTLKLGSWDVAATARGAAVDAHYNTMHAIRYFREKHLRFSTTGYFNPISVVAHAKFLDAAGNEYETNATNLASSWFLNTVNCGDGNYLQGGRLLPLCSAFDVVVHELAHGVTQNTSRLVYQNESGALNESFSDAMGASGENALEINDENRNFAIGEKIDRTGVGIRNMQHPTRDGSGSVDHYSKVAPCSKPDGTNDYCGVHYNSGIPNRAFALMTAGGVHELKNVSVAEGIGWSAARQLWFYTFTRLAPDADFKAAALAQVTEAKNHDLKMLQAVACAWHAVGVLAPEVHPALGALVCRAASPAPAKEPSASNCLGRSRGWYCNEANGQNAFECADGASVGTAVCADALQTCKKAGPGDSRATVSPQGALSCD